MTNAIPQASFETAQNGSLFTADQLPFFSTTAIADLWPQHPVVCNDYRFPTAPIEKSVVRCLSTIEGRVRGQAFHGSPGMGKSTAIEYLEEQIRIRFPNLPVVSWEAQSRAIPNSGEFHKTILESRNVIISKNTKAPTLGKQVANMLWALAVDANSNQIVLLIDEAQNYSSSEWRWLKTITGQLKKQKISATTISFGDDILVARKTGFATAQAADLVVRFLPKIDAFGGISSVEELKKFLSWYDTAQFPKDSGISFAAFFRQGLSEKGWRMEHEANHLWKAIVAVTGTPKVSVGIEPLVLAINEFLTSYREVDTKAVPEPDKIWRQLLSERHVSVQALYTPEA